MNVGNDPALPVPTDSLLVGGQARRPLLASDRGGVAVVLEAGKAGRMGKGGSV